MQDEPFSCTIHRVLVLNPVLSISSPGFQKSSPGFVKHESGFFSSPGPGFSRVRIFFESESGSESESGPGFEVCPCMHQNTTALWHTTFGLWLVVENGDQMCKLSINYYFSKCISWFLTLAIIPLAQRRSHGGGGGVRPCPYQFRNSQCYWYHSWVDCVHSRAILYYSLQKSPSRAECMSEMFRHSPNLFKIKSNSIPCKLMPKIITKSY